MGMAEGTMRVIADAADDRAVAVPAAEFPGAGAAGGADTALPVASGAEFISAEFTGAEAAEILDGAHDAFVAMNAAGLITAWNRAAEKMFGYSRAEALGQSLSSLIIPDRYRAAHDAGVARFLRTGASSVLGERREYDALRSTGETFPVEITHWSIDTPAAPTFYAFIRDITEHRAHERELARQRSREAELTHQALHDSLTGLANRHLALEHITRVLQRGIRHDAVLAVLFVDLDRFKLVNDSLGHDAGDELLIAAADRLATTVRGADLVARVSGDEFVVVCDELAHVEEANTVAERILDSLSAPVDIAAERIRIRSSIGIAFASRGGEEAAEDLLRDADAAMYRAKERGRGQVAIFTTDMRERLHNRLRMERELAECVDRGELELRYRPVVDLASGDVVGAQPLQFWRHPRMGLLQPGAYIPIAEQTGHIGPINAWADQAWADQVRAWRTDGVKPLFSSVNFTVREFMRSGFVDSMADWLAISGMDPAALGISVRIPAADGVWEPEVLRQGLAGLQALGISVGIAEFGAHGPELAWAGAFPFDLVKLAPRIAVDMDRRPRRRAVVRAIVEMARDTGMTTFIDGITSAAQRDCAVELGCDFGQGPFFGDAQPPDAAANWT